MRTRTVGTRACRAARRAEPHLRHCIRAHHTTGCGHVVCNRRLPRDHCAAGMGRLETDRVVNSTCRVVLVEVKNRSGRLRQAGDQRVLVQRRAIRSTPQSADAKPRNAARSGSRCRLFRSKSWLTFIATMSPIRLVRPHPKTGVGNRNFPRLHRVPAMRVPAGDQARDLRGRPLTTHRTGWSELARS